MDSLSIVNVPDPRKPSKKINNDMFAFDMDSEYSRFAASAVVIPQDDKVDIRDKKRLERQKKQKVRKVKGALNQDNIIQHMLSKFNEEDEEADDEELVSKDDSSNKTKSDDDRPEDSPQNVAEKVRYCTVIAGFNESLLFVMSRLM